MNQASPSPSTIVSPATTVSTSGTAGSLVRLSSTSSQALKSGSSEESASLATPPTSSAFASAAVSSAFTSVETLRPGLPGRLPATSLSPSVAESSTPLDNSAGIGSTVSSSIPSVTGAGSLSTVSVVPINQSFSLQSAPDGMSSASNKATHSSAAAHAPTTISVVKGHAIASVPGAGSAAPSSAAPSSIAALPSAPAKSPSSPTPSASGSSNIAPSASQPSAKSLPSSAPSATPSLTAASSQGQSLSTGSVPSHIVVQSNTASLVSSTTSLSSGPSHTSEATGSSQSPPAPTSPLSSAPISPTQAGSEPHSQASSPSLAAPSSNKNSASSPELAPSLTSGGTQTHTVAASHTATSTVIIHPESTLSSPLFVPTTDSRGHTTLSIPPVITSVSLSQEANGSFVSVTQIIANPTGIWGISDTAGATRHGFLANGGAVAGVFVVIGIVIATAGAALGVILCKRRRRQRIRLSISRPLPMPDNPFEDPRDSPSPTQMRYAASDSSHRNLVGSGLGVQPPTSRTLLDDEFEDVPVPVMSHSPTRHTRNESLETSFAGVGAGGKSIGKPPIGLPYTGPFSNYVRAAHQRGPSDASSTGMAITTDVQNISSSRARMRPASLTPSTPSIYPPSLPPSESDDTTHDSSHGPMTPAIEGPILFPLAKPARPPRKRPVAPGPMRMNTDLRQKPMLIETNLEAEEAENRMSAYEPMTPPASVITNGSIGSISPTRSANPFSDYNAWMSGVTAPAEAKTRDNFYTRRRQMSTELRPRASLEWKS